MPSTTKTAAFENAPGAILRGGTTSSTVLTTQFAQIPIECAKATTLTVTVTLNPSGASGDLTVVLLQSNAGYVTPSATTITPSSSSGPTLASGTTTFTATYPVTGLNKVWLKATNNNAGTVTITVTQSNDISSSL